ncbi:hypothetical protein Cabther_B0256 [Chloracidobacterium thermophilum B]|uniref:Uncharacterized protein n=2 Tax=Chloracidobacterium thermophilum TaxID=458033 RepID=G2LKH2_CHLTF|nr:hypothetical protein Cabther_B0256 [Chloracidobacterium thermophilum B]
MEFDTSPAAECRLTRSDTFAVGLFTVLYILQVAHAAVTRSFWLDELFTFYIVTMPDWAGMMDLIQRGPDQNPPLFYALTRLVVSVLSEGEWAFRLPAMTSYGSDEKPTLPKGILCFHAPDLHLRAVPIAGK